LKIFGHFQYNFYAKYISINIKGPLVLTLYTGYSLLI
jgi:hypothetical protein